MPILTMASSKGDPSKSTVCELVVEALAGSRSLVVLNVNPA